MYYGCTKGHIVRQSRCQVERVLKQEEGANATLDVDAAPHFNLQACQVRQVVDGQGSANEGQLPARCRHSERVPNSDNGYVTT